MALTKNMISIDEGLRNNLLYIISKESFESKIIYYEDLIENQIEEKQLNYILKVIIDTMEKVINHNLENSHELQEQNGFNPEIIRELEELGRKIKSLRSNINESSLFNSEIIHLIKKYVEKHYMGWILSDLNNGILSHIEDLKFFKSEVEINIIIEEYQTAYKNKDIAKLKEILSSIQNEIVKDWEKNMTDVDRITQNDFMFLGHSMKTSNFEGSFRSDYISCSLFTPEFNYTFNNRFGFILSPDNIKGADWQDMHVLNYSNSDDDIIRSSVPIIHHPLRIIEELKKQRNMNEAEGVDRNVYSETVIKGFNPTAIFCFTTGAKSLDGAYVKALELQKKVGIEKLVVIDVLRLKHGKELEEFKHEFLKELYYNYQTRMKKTDIEYHRAYYMLIEKNLNKFDMFFERFDNLKNNENYTEDDIMKLFDYNFNLIISFDMPDSKEDTKYLLDKGFNFEFEKIFKGEADDPFIINRLVNYEKYNDKIDEIYPGFSNFIMLIKRVPVSEEIYEKMKELNGELNFINMSKFMTSKVLPLIEQQEASLNDNLLTKRMRKRELEKEKETTIDTISKHEKFEYIKSNVFYLSILEYDSNDIDREEKNIKNELEEYNIKRQKLFEEKDKMQARIDAKKEEKQKQQEKDINERQKILEEQSNKLTEMQRRPLRNFFKIRKLKNDIELLKIKNNLLFSAGEYEVEFGEIHSIEKEIHSIEIEISYLDIKIDYAKKRLERIKDDKKRLVSRLNEYYGVDSLESAKMVVEEAIEFESIYDYNVESRLSEIDLELEELEQQIADGERTAEIIQEEKEKISKNL